MNGDGRANPRAEFTAARAEGQSDPRRDSDAETEPISCEDRVGGGSARSFKSAGVGEKQLCSASGRRRSCWRIQESCQSGTKWLVETQVKARRRKREAQKGSSPLARSQSQRSTRLSGTAPVRSTLGPWERERHRLSTQMGPCAHPLRRSRREAAFRSPYSSMDPLCSPSESDSDLEPVGAGIQHLQKLSQELNEAIVAEDSGDMTISLLRD
ncbi:protein PIMREG isoform X2 [Pteropus alecto]|uniref:protein PIMREG isoform X2 n=1 Tax=Pteropus alecto TaxID=9402 RepID=UPI0007687C4D|nr:protein PIMREG isoform X2 [Pteropus alecto]